MKFIYWSFITLITLLLLWVNVQLYKPTLNKEEKESDIIKQLHFLEKELKENHLGTEMQMIFPEGFVFINALYGLSWAELAQQSDNSEAILHGLQEAQFAYQAIDSPQGKAPFVKSLALSYGVYYQGWRNYLLAKILSISDDFYERQHYADAFQTQCDELARIFNDSYTPYLVSYPNMAWPADSFLAMASLAIHDQIFEPKYQGLIERWLEQVKRHRDPETNMLAHKVDAGTGNMTEPPRGGSMSLMMRMLIEIDSDFAQEQYALFKQHFVSTALGLPKVREYPKGTFGIGDIDSGPVILGTSFAGTIVSIGTFQAFGEAKRAENQYKTVTAFGFSQSSEEERSYLFGMLPMADAFIAWARTSPAYLSASESNSTLWRLRFQFTSLVILALFIAFYKRKGLISYIKQSVHRSNKRDEPAQNKRI